MDLCELLVHAVENAISRRPVQADIDVHPIFLAEADRALASMNFGYTLLLLAFCPGAILFYWLLFKSRLVPRALSLWGLITVIPVFFAIVLSVLGINLSFYFVVPYIPFEFVIGVWILIRGVRNAPA